MEQDGIPLGTLIGYRLKEAQSVLRSRMDEALRPLGLTTPQYACLELLSRNPGASNSELARDAFVTRQTMSTLLQSLQQRGLVERPAKASSGRALPTTLTTLGVQMLAQATKIVEVIEQQMINSLSEEQRNGFHLALTSCIEALKENGPKDGLTVSS